MTGVPTFTFAKTDAILEGGVFTQPCERVPCQVHRIGVAMANRESRHQYHRWHQYNLGCVAGFVIVLPLNVVFRCLLQMTQTPAGVVRRGWQSGYNVSRNDDFHFYKPTCAD